MGRGIGSVRGNVSVFSAVVGLLVCVGCLTGRAWPRRGICPAGMAPDMRVLGDRWMRRQPGIVKSVVHPTPKNKGIGGRSLHGASFVLARERGESSREGA